MNEAVAGRAVAGGTGRAIPPAGARPRPGIRVLRMSAVAMGALFAGIAALGVRNSLTTGSAADSPGEIVSEIAGPEADAVLRALRQTPQNLPSEPQPAQAERGGEPDDFWLLAAEPPLVLPPVPQPAMAVDTLEQALWRRKRESPVLVYSRDRLRGERTDGPDTGGFDSPDVLGTGFGDGAQADSLAGRLQASTFAPVQATALDGLDSRILEGTVIACTLESAISSAVPGMTLCRTRIPVYSQNGAFELIPAGSRVIGEYRGGVESGHARIFVLWRRLITPDGVSVALSSPGAGPLGRGGHEGHLDQKWGDRFASALMVSLVAGAVPDGGGLAAAATAAALQDTAISAIRHELAVVPELTKLQGEPIAIIVARDLDFGEAMQRRFEAAGSEAGVLVFERP